MEDYKERLKEVKRLTKKIGKERVGLPNKVIFYYDKGKVTAFPKKHKWVVEANGKTHTTFTTDRRNDITKYKARLYLKFLLSGLWKGEKIKKKKTLTE